MTKQTLIMPFCITVYAFHIKDLVCLGLFESNITKHDYVTWRDYIRGKKTLDMYQNNVPIISTISQLF